METIKKIQAIEIIDSRGNPTVRVIMETSSGITAAASVPSGASTGENEALELRDKDLNRYFGKGVLKAVNNVNQIIQKELVGKSPLNQRAIDQSMIELDGTENKSKLGANSILGVSLANARLIAQIEKKQLYEIIQKQKEYILPSPMMNIINGGAHADNFLDFQEFMIQPNGIDSFSEKLRCGSEIFHCLKTLLNEKGYSTSVGDEGGFAPPLKSNEEALDFIMRAIEKAKYKPLEQVSIALDPAASEFYDKKNKKYIEKKKKALNEKYAIRDADEMVSYYKSLCAKYPIVSIEDGLAENDWDGWKKLTNELGSKTQIVGDDLFVTNQKFLKKGIDQQTANAILIKLNQIGTLSETLDAIHLAQKNNYNTVISHRSGETEDSFIADLAVAVNSGQIKTGSLSRSDRTAKYNRLLEIEQNLNSNL